MSKKKDKRVLSNRPIKKTVDVRETVTDWYLFVMLLIYPLWLPRDFTAVEKPKFVFFAALTIVWFILLVVFSFIEGPITGFFTPARISAIVFAAICLLSAIFSPFDFSENIIGHRYTGLLTQLLLALTMLGVSRFGHCKERHFLAFGISITILCVLCIVQKMGINPLGFFPGNITVKDFLGTIGNIDTLAALISLPVPLFLGLSVERESPYDKLYLIPLFLSSLVLILGGAESGIMGVGVVAVVTPAFLVRSMRDLRRTLASAAVALAGAALGDALVGSATMGEFAVSFSFGTLAIGCLVLAAVLGAASWLLRYVRWEPSARVFLGVFIGFAVAAVIGALTVVWFWPGERGSLYQASQILHGHIEDSYGSSRIRIWRVTLTNVPDRPLLGGGPGTLHLRTVAQLKTGIARLAHNVYLQFLVDTGVLGLLSYLTAIVMCLFVRRRDQWKQVCTGLILAAMSYAVQDFFNLGVPVVSPFFWIFLGLLQTDTHERPETALK